MSAITTHVLDLAHGRPAAAVPVRLERRSAGPAGGWTELGRATTDADGRARSLLPAGAPLEPGTYRLSFELAAYFAAAGTPSFFPEAAVVFEVGAAREHCHVPLLAGPYGYTTYRGS